MRISIRNFVVYYWLFITNNSFFCSEFICIKMVIKGWRG